MVVFQKLNAIKAFLSKQETMTNAPILNVSPSLSYQAAQKFKYYMESLQKQELHHKEIDFIDVTVKVLNSTILSVSFTASCTEMKK